MPTNHQIHLDNRPVGEAVASNFKLVTAETPALQDGQVLQLDKFSDEAVDILIENIAKFRAVVGTERGYKAVRII